MYSPFPRTRSSSHAGLKFPADQRKLHLAAHVMMSTGPEIPQASSSRDVKTCRRGVGTGTEIGCFLPPPRPPPPPPPPPPPRPTARRCSARPRRTNTSISSTCTTRWQSLPQVQPPRLLPLHCHGRCLRCCTRTAMGTPPEGAASPATRSQRRRPPRSATQPRCRRRTVPEHCHCRRSCSNHTRLVSRRVRFSSPRPHSCLELKLTHRDTLIFESIRN
jgi:hypothetical protein